MKLNQTSETVIGASSEDHAETTVSSSLLDSGCKCKRGPPRRVLTGGASLVTR
eukprot:m.31329 g.31329  ORF g.31329 m.31329 type:complete len:53 (+) comp16441_c0_seq1:235-393(+)